jgi:hypothetical protein
MGNAFANSERSLVYRYDAELVWAPIPSSSSTVTTERTIHSGQPVPKSRQVYLRENWLVRHLWLARVAARASTEIRHPQHYVPDPTERLVSQIREFVEAHGARLMVGLQRSDDKLLQHPQAERNPFVTFNDAEASSDRFGGHWTPAGHKLVAERLPRLLSENHIVRTDDLLRSCPRGGIGG